MMIPIVISIVTLILLALPFFLVKPEPLQEGSSVNSIEKLQKIKESLLKRYIEDEDAYQRKVITEGVWNRRKHYLTSRYIDAARREDYLNHINHSQSKVSQ